MSTETQRAAFLSRVPEEPAEGEAGTAKICFHVGQTQVRQPPLRVPRETGRGHSLGGGWGGGGLALGRSAGRDWR